MAGRPPGGVPCLDKWKAFIFSCIFCGNPPPVALGPASDGGFRALFTIPSGCDEAVIGFAPCGSLEALSEGGIRNETGGPSCEGAEGAVSGVCESSGSVEFEDESEFFRAKSCTSTGGPAD